MVLPGPNSTLTIDIDGVVARSAEGEVVRRYSLERWAIFTIYASTVAIRLWTVLSTLLKQGCEGEGIHIK